MDGAQVEFLQKEKDDNADLFKSHETTRIMTGAHRGVEHE